METVRDRMTLLAPHFFTPRCAMCAVPTPYRVRLAPGASLLEHVFGRNSGGRYVEDSMRSAERWVGETGGQANAQRKRVS